METKNPVTSNQKTIDVYKDVINDVINTSSYEWKKNGGNLQTLQRIQEIWLYRSLLSCGIVTPEPKNSTAKSTQKIDESQIRDIFADFDNLGNDQEDKSNDDSDKSDENDMTSGSGSDLTSDEEEYSEEEESDDPEINELLKPIIPTDTLLCSYVNFPKDKKSKNSKIITLEVQNVHLTENGVPRVIKNGTIRITH